LSLDDLLQTLLDGRELNQRQHNSTRMTAVELAVPPAMRSMSPRAGYSNDLADANTSYFEHIALLAFEGEKISFVALCLNAEQAHFTPALRTEQQGFHWFGPC